MVFRFTNTVMESARPAKVSSSNRGGYRGIRGQIALAREAGNRGGDMKQLEMFLLKVSVGLLVT